MTRTVYPDEPTEKDRENFSQRVEALKNRLTMNNESAHPFNEYVGPTNEMYKLHRGLTKREWFAGMAMQGMVAHFGMQYNPTHAEDSFKLADAMIEQSKKSI